MGYAPMTKHGVILAGGAGTRLQPFTNYFSKSLFPIGNKFIIDYPIATLKSLGVSDLTIILGDRHFQQIVAYLKDGAAFGMKVNYIFQATADGIASGINLAKDIIGNDDFYVCLGDNVFVGDISLNCIGNAGCGIVLKEHAEIERFGVASIGRDGIVKIQEKPKLEDLPSGLGHYAITGFYKFNGKFWDYFTRLKPSKRGEFEIAEIINHYYQDNDLGFVITASQWTDTGTFEGIEQARKFINGDI
jgi:glucose-1-phosphate thymidylyltransferase